MAFIEVKGLTKEYASQYRKIIAVNDISFALEEGDFVAIKGKSGSGKSTLLHLLAGLTMPDKGEISIDGVVISKTNKKDIQKFRIVIPLHINHIAVDMDQVEMLLHEIGIYHLKDAFPNELSGGEQQRVAIVRALIHNPKLLLLDEPTGNLDSINTQILLDCLKKIHKLKKPTILLVTHDDEVANIACKKMVIKDGKIERFG